MKLAIVGAGIGGLASAILASRAGASVRVYERASELREIGAGMTLWPNAVRVLEEIGLLDEVRGVSHVFEESAVGDYRGRVWTRMPMGDVGRKAGLPTLLIARGSLYGVLARHAAAVLGEGAIETGRELVGVHEVKGQVLVSFRGGDEATHDGAVGADGVASQVRQSMFGTQATRFHGRTSFRGICHDFDLRVGSSDFEERHGPDGRFAFYRVGERSVAWYANVLRRVAVEEDPYGLLTASFGSWADPVPEIVLKSSATAIHVTAISDVDPLSSWTIGRVTLLGDAAHPMTPDLGQGAGQALEDASALGAALRANGDTSSAFLEYERARRPRATEIVLGSRKTGHIANLRGPFGLLMRRALWSLLPPKVAIERMTKVVLGSPLIH